jgi:hypothetical protein
MSEDNKNDMVSQEVAAAQAAAPSVAEKLSIEEQAASTFHYGYPEFVKIVDSLSMKQLKRVLKALVEAPLSKTKPVFNVENEGVAFKLGMAIMNAKFIMFQSAIAEQMLKEREKEVAQPSESVDTQEVDQTNNKESESG